MNRTFEDRPGVRTGGVTKIGIMGPSGGGKTFSALRLATGIQRVVGGDIGVVDTENGRALMYAEYFKFRHVDFKPPYRSMDYVAAFEHFVSKGVKNIVVDSMSHEHAGLGGYLEFAEAELDRMAGDNYGKRQACKLASYIEPSKARRKMIDAIINMRVNFIFCFRAKEKVKPLRDQNNKLEITNIGFMPIAGSELVFEMDACCLLLPHAGGVPTWQSDELGEKMMIKTAIQFSKIFEKPQPLSEEIGQQLAQWAQGTAKTPVPPATTAGAPLIGNQVAAAAGEQTTAPFDEPINPLIALGDAEAKKGMPALKAWYLALPKSDQATLRAKLDTDWKPIADKIPTSLPQIA